MRAGNAGPRVFDGNLDMLPVFSRPDRDTPVLGSKLERVAQKIDKYLGDLFRISPHPHETRRDLIDQSDVLLNRLGPEQDLHLLADPVEIQRFQMERHAVRFDLGDIQEVVDETGQAEGITLDDDQLFRLFRGQRPCISPHQELEISQERGEGGAKFVSHIADKILLQMVQLLEFLGHHVELERQFAEFIVRLDLQTVMQPSLPEKAGPVP